MTKDQHVMFATLVDMMARGEAFGENDFTPHWNEGFQLLLQGVLTDEDGMMIDDDDAIQTVAKQLMDTIIKNADKRHAYLVAQAQAA